MSGEVFANGREISGKATSNKSLGAMADVCLSPPAPPAGPIPIPYPNFSNAGDTDKGSKSVKLRGKPAGLKDKSTYKTSKGDEAATRNFGMGVVSHKISGATHFGAWSMNVLIEGCNAQRQLDLTTHNHGSPFNLAAIVSNAKFAPAAAGDANCEALNAREEDKRKAGPKAVRTAPTTHTAGHYKSPNGKGYNMIASSKRLRGAKYDDYAVGIEPGGESKLCGNYEHKSPKFMPKSSHTEARMIEEIFSMAPGAKGGPGSMGSLVMRIAWQQRNGRIKRKPCRDCRKLICQAEKCGLEVLICTDGSAKPRRPCPPKGAK